MSLSPSQEPDRGWCGDPKRGAAMGRDSDGTPDASKLHLRRVRINSGGYDSGGAYWGIGAPLFEAWDDEGNFRYFTRAADRVAAKSKLHAEHASARFFR